MSFTLCKSQERRRVRERSQSKMALIIKEALERTQEGDIYSWWLSELFLKLSLQPPPQSILWNLSFQVFLESLLDLGLQGNRHLFHNWDDPRGHVIPWQHQRAWRCGKRIICWTSMEARLSSGYLSSVKAIVLSTCPWSDHLLWDVGCF